MKKWEERGRRGKEKIRGEEGERRKEGEWKKNALMHACFNKCAGPVRGKVMRGPSLRGPNRTAYLLRSAPAHYCERNTGQETSPPLSPNNLQHSVFFIVHYERGCSYIITTISSPSTTTTYQLALTPLHAQVSLHIDHITSFLWKYILALYSVNSLGLRNVGEITQSSQGHLGTVLHKLFPGYSIHKKRKER